MAMIGTRMVRPIRTIRTGTRRTQSCPATAFVSLLPWNYYTTTAAATSIQATPAASSQLFIVSHSVRPMSSLVAVFPFSSSSSSAQHAYCHPTVFKSVFSTTSGENSNNNNNDDDNVRKKEKDAIVLPPPLHYKPWADRRKSDTNGIEVETVRGFIRVKRKNRLSPTRDLNFTADMWRTHKSPYRHLNTSRIWCNSSFQRLLFPDLTIIATISVSLSVLTLYGGEYGIFGPDGLLMDNVKVLEKATEDIIQGAVTVVMLLLGYRVNTTYGRYVEARRMWGDVTNASRDLARIICAYVRPPPSPTTRAIHSGSSSNTATVFETVETTTTTSGVPVHVVLETIKQRMLNLQRIYPIALRFFLHRRGSHHNLDRKDPNFKLQVYVEFRAECLDMWKTYNDDDMNSNRFDNNDTPPTTNNTNTAIDPDLIRILDAFQEEIHVPLLILNMISESLTALSHLRLDENTGNNTPVIELIFIREMDRQIQRMTPGPFERILRTPLPSALTRYASQMMTLICFAFPIGSITVLGPYLNPIGSCFAAYMMMAVDDIGIQLEEPFNILPQQQYTDGIVDAINLIESSFVVNPSNNSNTS